MISRCFTRGRALDQGLFIEPSALFLRSGRLLSLSTEGNSQSWLMEKIRGQEDLELPLLFDIFVVFWPSPSACGGETPSEPQRLVWREAIRSVCITNKREVDISAIDHQYFTWTSCFENNPECRLYNCLEGPSRVITMKGKINDRSAYINSCFFLYHLWACDCDAVSM